VCRSVILYVVARPNSFGESNSFLSFSVSFPPHRYVILVSDKVHILRLPSYTNANKQRNAGVLKLMGETLSLLFRVCENDAYEVQLKESWSGHTVCGKFVPPYTPKQVSTLQKKLNTLQSSDAELRDVGYLLFRAICALEPGKNQLVTPEATSVQTVFQGVILRTLKRRGTVALSLIFEPGCEEFVRYPWELLHNGNHFLTASGVFTLSRSLLRADSPVGCELPVHPPFRMLYISASPSNFAPLETERSFQAIEEALTPLIDSGQIFLDRLEPPTFGQFVRYLNSYGGAGMLDDNETMLPCYVVHFDGHGAYGKLCPKDDCETINSPYARKCGKCGYALGRVPAQTYLCFCDENGYNSFVDTQALRRVLVSSDVRLAVFSACETAMMSHDSEHALEGSLALAAVDSTLATSLVTAQIPAVVAMPFSVQDDLSSTFMYHFYEALADGRTLEEALSRARQSLLSMPQKSWFIPVLYRHVAEGEEGPVALMVKPDAQDEHAHPLSHLGPPATFVGRERELHDIELLIIAAATGQQKVLARGEKRLRQGYHHLALTGPPGIGKSALALEAIRLNRDKFLGGIIGVSLEESKTFQDALLEIIHALPIQARNTHTMDAKQLARLVHGTLRSLSSRELPCLLLFDSFEEVKERAELEQWLQFFSLVPPEVVVVVTSHSNPENMMVVEGITSRWYEYPVEKMTSNDLLMLFTDLAASNGLDQRIHLEDVKQQEILQEICLLLDGYPLGAELIFGTARSIGGQVFTPEAATRSLEEVRDELYSNPLAGIMAVLEVSCQRLTAPARLLLSYLAAFRLPFSSKQISMLVSPDTLEAAHELVQIPLQPGDGSHTSSQETSIAMLPQHWREARDELVQASFVTFDGQAYLIHSQIRHFALSRLPQAERRRVHRVVGAYYYNLPQPGAEEWIEAFEHLVAAGEAQDIQEAIRVALRAADTFKGAGLFSMLQSILRQAVGYATRLDNQTSASQLQGHLGTLLRQLGRYAEAEVCLKSSLMSQQWHDAESESVVGWSLAELSLLYADEGDFQQALTYAQDAQSFFEHSGSDQGLAWSYNVLGVICRRRAQYQDALTHFEQAYLLCSQGADVVGRAKIGHNRGMVYMALGQYHQAIRDFEEALRLFNELKRPLDQAWVLASKAMVHCWQGKLELAEKACLELLPRFREYQLPLGEAQILRTLGNVYCRKQDFLQARGYYTEALTLLTSLGARIDLALTFNACGALFFAEGTYLDAKEKYEQAQFIAQECGAQHIYAVALFGQGNVARVLRQFIEAEQYYREADEIFLHLDPMLKSEHSKIWYNLGLLYEAQQKYSEALNVWLQALNSSNDMNDPYEGLLREKVAYLVAQYHLEAEYSVSRESSKPA
jgi:tetratricopeptide (TPR) repeat protein